MILEFIKRDGNTIKFFCKCLAQFDAVVSETIETKLQADRDSGGHERSRGKYSAAQIGKDFMLSHGYIKHDFDVKKWAAPEFLEQAAKELLEEQWKKVSTAKLPDATELLKSSQRVGRAGCGSTG
jgi:hypothetical protein